MSAERSRLGWDYWRSARLLKGRNVIAILAERTRLAAALRRSRLRRLVGDDAPQIAMDLAMVAAEAHFDLKRVRQRQDSILAALERGFVDARALKMMASFSRYEQRAVGRRNRALRRLQQTRRLPLFG